ncbi:transglycosylase SLT domain-containing protein [Streptomyces sp. PanSC9]|uniref:transglycosylase SLT domain-containing protein n=1 Tax=Streptomyces sp. PanSC9 TaxID=1520461 RepID=UPI000F46FF08|nr:transglycosylase SLT domain-containing protein [Streptomyces sp. PanSC9]ROP53271.1 phage-related protein [Streptomyces sp. PanSC9]
MPTNVGSVVASVVPDVSDFATRATAALTPQADRLGQNLGRTLSRSMTRAVDFSGIDNALRRSLDTAEASAANKGRQIGKRYGQAMKAGLSEELRGLQGSLDVRIRPVIDRSAYRAVQADLDVLTRTRTVSIVADADTRAAADDLALLTRPRSVTITANADTAGAAAQLAALARNRTATIHTNVNGSQAGQASGLISGITGAASGAGSAVAGLASKVALLGSAAPVIGSLVNVVAAIAPAAALAVPAVAALGSAFGAIKLGTSGLGNAFKAAFAPTDSTKAVKSANQVASAEQGVKRAVEQVGVARENAASANQAAARQVVSAERDLTTSQQSAKQAQLDLNAAHEEAVQNLRDLHDQLTHSALDQRSATLAVKQAQEDLYKVLADPKASELQREQAQLTYDEAKQNLEDQTQKQKDLKKQVAEADKAGVEGAKNVIDAKKAQAQADQDVKDKEQALADARAAQAKTARDGARSIAQAQQAVADAQQRVAEAQQSAASGTNKLNDALAKLSPNARAFVSSVQGLKPAWDAMQLGVQDRLFAGLGSRLTDVGSRVIPILRGGLEGTAGVLNRMGKGALDAVNNLAKTGMLKKILDGATQSLKPLQKAPGQIVTAFGQIAVAAQPAFQKITTGLGAAITKVTDKLGKAFESGAMEKAIDQAVSLLGDLMDVGKNVFSILGDIFTAGAGSGGGTIQVLKTITGEIAKITSSPEVQGGLKALFSVMGTIAKTVAPLLGTALKFVGQIFEKLGPPIETIVMALGDALKPVIDALGPVLVIVADAIGKILVAVSPLIPVIGQLLAAALKPLGPVFAVIGKVIEKIAPVIATLADALGPILTPILEGLGAVLGQLVTQYADMFLQLIQQLAPVIPKLIPPLVGIAKSLGSLLLAIAPLLPQIMLLTTQFVTQLLPAVLPLLPPLLQLVDLLVRLAVWVIEKVVLPAIQGLITFVKDMGRKLQPFIDAVKHVTEWIAEKFKWLYDRLVGHSVPELIEGIRDWFNTGKQWIRGIWNTVWDNTVGRVVSGGKTVGEKVAAFARGVRDRFNDAKRWVSDKWSGLWSGIAGTVTSMRRTIEGRVRDFRDGVVGFFQKAVDGIHTAWSKLSDIAKKPVRFLVETVFNNGLRKVWNNTAAKLPGIGEISPMRLPRGFATGGILPGYTPGRDVHRFVSPTGGVLDLSGGESIMRPEVTRAVGRGGINALNAAARSGGVAGVQALLSEGLPHRAFWGGGIWDDITDNPVTNAVKSVAGKGVDLLKKGVDWARGGVANLAEKTLKTLLGVSSLKVDPGKQTWSGLVGNVPVMLANKVVSFIRGKEDDGAGSSTALKGYKPSAGVKQWTSVVLKALKEVGQPASLLSSTLRRMQQESGGNPRIVNKWDSNWQAGHPSVGLMQVIGPTYRSYAGKYKNKGPFLYGTSVDPLANVYSSMRYAMAAYGSLHKAYDRPGGYAKGGFPRMGEVAWVGEEGPELVRFLGPAQVYPHHESMRMARGMGSIPGFAKGGTISAEGKGSIAAVIGKAFLEGLQGSTTEIKNAVAKVTTAIKNAFKGVKSSIDDKLLKSLAASSAKLQALATKRDQIAAQIAAAKQMATDQTAAGKSFASMTSLPNGGNTFDAKGILSGLRVRLGQLKAFSANIGKLSKMGLSKELLQQIISAGPDSGAAYAQALVNATPAELKSINVAQAQIDKASKQYGNAAADAMYDAGSKAGDGFLTGLKAQQKAIENQMSDLAKAIQKAIKKALKIKSPSRVMAEIGEHVGQGLVMGMDATHQAVVTSANQMAGAVQRGVGIEPAARQAPAQQPVIFNANVTDKPTRQTVMDALRDYNALYGVQIAT